MEYASFDLEIAKEIPEDTENWDDLGLLGISCAAIAFSDQEDVKFWRARGSLSREKCQKMVRQFEEYAEQGYVFLTWNGLSFDFKILAQESGMFDECAHLALYHHVDMMLFVTFVKGWYLGLQTALEGAGLEGKLKEVILNDGTLLYDMEGAKAPSLWAQGEYKAVLAYLEEDVLQPLQLIRDIEHTKSIRWISKKGNQQKCRVPHILKAYECFNTPHPDTSWMDDPPTRKKFVEWIPGYEDLIDIN